MTYRMFLLVFLGIPIGVLVLLLRRSLRREHMLWLGLLMGIALIYTTPWDNYLVANRVWWYEPQLVMGITLGWVPLEEYIFFLLQPLMTGLWTLLLSRIISTGSPKSKSDGAGDALRWGAVSVGGVLWFASLLLLISGWHPGTYLGLVLVWAVPPILLQLAVGADVLWQHRRRVLIALISSTVYLAGADALAIDGGTWTINPALSLNLLIGGVLPVEELIFFLVTNTLIVFAISLVSASEVRMRLQQRVRLLSQAQSAE